MHGIAIIDAPQHEARSGVTVSPGRNGTDIYVTDERDDRQDWAGVLAPRLAQFAAVARHEHVTRAAAELGVPQSSLSRAVVRLEEDLGVALFARHGRTVSLTPAGRDFLASVEGALEGV
ncbi:LysR family transcriptional regulator, partial [Streptomyces sp. A7024]